jgi:hypothetical protein
MAAVPALAFSQGAFARQRSVTAIDIALEPDATMVQHAEAANARLLKSFPKGFALDETHHPHVSVLQQFVRTDDLDKIFAAANAVTVKEKPAYGCSRRSSTTTSPIGRSVLRELWPNRPTICIGGTELITAVKPYTVKTGTPAAFFSEAGGRDIQKSLIEYVANFVAIAASERFNSHVTIGVATKRYLNKMLAEPFRSFTFSPAGASVYQLGTFGTARR